jgi:hypothetical protein
MHAGESIRSRMKFRCDSRRGPHDEDIDSFREQRQALLLLRFMVQGDRELKGKKRMSATRATARLRRKLAELTPG